MFKELVPMLATRSIIISVYTAKALGPEGIRLVIAPRSLGKDEAKEVIQPFPVEGTAEEFDKELGSSSRNIQPNISPCL
jgi:hypothetical protein